MPDVDLRFYEIDQERADAFGKTWDAPASASQEDLFKECDIIDICLPTNLHVEFALKAVAAGRAVLLEKPIGRTLEEARQLVEAVDKAKTPFMVGQVVRFFHEFSTANRVVKNGGIGTPSSVRTRRGGAAPAGRPWFMDHSKSGGVVMDLAVHDFDWLRWTFGEVKHLYSQSRSARVGQGPDYSLTTLTFESGTIGHVEATWMDPSGFRVTIEVAGSEGLIAYDSRQNQAVKVSKPGSNAVDSNLSPMDDPYYLEMRAFVEAVRDGKESPVTAYDGFMALSIAQAAIESAQTGKVVVPSRG